MQPWSLGALWELLTLLLIQLAEPWSLRTPRNVNPQKLNAVHAGLAYMDVDHKDTAFFKILSVDDGRSVLIGTRNAVLNISLSTMSVQKALDWAPSAGDVDLCMMKGKSEENCHNFVRLLFNQPNNRLIVCGTNAYKPTCRQYRRFATGAYQIVKDFDGIAVVPFDPRQNTTAVYLQDSDELYTATVADFSATQPLVYRRPLSGPSAVLRTARDDVKCLNSPQFVSSFAHQDSVYFWFRETAAEYSNCGWTVFSRVARVCKSDQGDHRPDTDTWTSFLKARLNCSLPGRIPFYFNEIQYTTEVINTDRNGRTVPLVYAVFSTQDSLLQASAVCAFSMDDVRAVFEHGAFKVQKHPSSAWLPLDRSSLPAPRPGDCSATSKALNDDVVSFVRRHNLMDDTVPSHYSQPLVVDTTEDRQLTSIAVQPGVTALDGRMYDMIFVGTSDGSVLKYVNLVNADPGRQVNTVLVETMQLFAHRMPVRDLRITKSSLGEPSLLASTDSVLKLVPIHYCANRTSCRACIQLQDPYCAWDVIHGRCVGKSDGSWRDGEYAQNVLNGQAPQCVSVVGESDEFYMNDINPAYALIESPSIYTAECMAIAVIVTFVLASTIAFFIGYRFALWKAAFDAVPGFDSPLRKNLKSRTDNFEAYMPHMPVSKPTANGSSMTIPYTEAKSEKNLLTLNNGTLPRDYKAKKVYV